MDVHETVLQNMKEMAKKFSEQGVTLEMPPQSNKTLGTKYVELDPGKKLVAEFEYNEKFANPLGAFQGGFLCAAFDDVCGPLTYMAAEKPVVTIEMSTTFLRPFTEQTGTLTISAEVVSQGKSLLVLKAEARSKDNKLIATSTSHSLIVPDKAAKPK